VPGNTVSGSTVHSTDGVQSEATNPLRGQGAEEAVEKQRKSGMEFLGDISWGAHLCQFYRTKQDLIDLAVPYLKAGLENNEFCLWVASDPLDPQEAFEAMIAAWPSCEEYVERGQIKFLNHTQWYHREGPFDPHKMVEITVDIVNRALKNEYCGMRISSNMSWIEKSEWRTLADFEENLDRLNGAHPLLSMCSYHLDKCGPAEIIDVVRNHGAAILKQGETWQVLRQPTKTAAVEEVRVSAQAPDRAADKALTESDEQMQAVFEGVRDATVILDMAGKIVRVNKRAPELLGHGEAALIGKQFALLKVFPPSRAAEMFSAQARTLAGYEVPPFEIEAIAESGRKLDVEVRISPMKREAKVLGAVAVIRDITMRRQAEERLRAAQERNQLVVQNAGEGIMVIQDGAVKFANPKMIELVGYSEDEILLKPVTELVHPDDRRAVMAGQFKRLRGEEVAHVQDLRIVDKNGVTKWAEFNAVLFAWDGRPADLYFVNDITERRQAQEALVQGERNYKQLFESTLDGLEVVDGVTGKIVLANPVCAKVFGFASPADMIGTDPLECVPEEDRERVGDMFTESLLRDELHRVEELRAVTKDGREIWISVVGVKTEFQGGLAGLVSIRDITGQRRAEERLSASQADLQVIFDGVLDGIVLFDKTGKVIRANKSVLENSGLAEEDIVGRNFDDLGILAPESAEAVQSVAKELLAGKDLDNLELDVHTKSGKILRVEARITVLKRDGEMVGAIAVLRDISYRKQAEDALRQQERYFKALIERTSDAIAVVDRNGKPKYLSPSCEHMLGYSMQDVDEEGTGSASEYVHPDDIGAMRERFAHLLEAEGASSLDEVRVRHKDGDWRVVEATSTNLLNDPSVEGIVVNLRDITDRQQADVALKESEKRYRLLADNASDVIWIMNMDMRLTYVSPSVVGLCGYTSEEIVSQTLQEILTSPSFDSATKAWTEEQAEEDKGFKDLHRSRVLQLEMNCKNGSTVWIEVKASFLRDDEGKAIGVLGVARDIAERRKAQQSVEESEKRYRLLSDNVSDVIWTMDMKMRLTYISPSVNRLRGYTVDEILVAPAEESFTPESALVARKSIEKLLKANDALTGQGERRTSTVELEMQCKGGSTVWTETRLSLVGGTEGQPVGLIGITRDITERKKTEKALQESEKRYRLLAENVSDVIWVTDLNTRPIYVSPSVERLLGYTVDEAISAGMDKMVTRESGRQATERMAKALSLIRQDPKKVLKPGNIELEFKRKDGSTIWVDTTVAVVRDANGQPVEFMGVLHDITERKKSEKAVSESEGRFRSLIETTSDWVWEVNEKLVYTYVSRKIRDILGYEPEEVVGKAPVDLMPLKEANRVAKVFNDALTQKRPFAFVENVCLHKDGRKVVLETSGVPFFDANGNVSGFRGIDRDVTERKRTEEAAQESFRKLQRTVEGTIQAIALTVETRDPYTAGHQRRVTKLAYAIASEMGLPNDQIQRVRIAGLLHDLGKIFIPTEILSKPGQLTEVEFSIIKSHPQAGHEILKDIEFPWPIADVVVQHHERINGSGYPAGLKDEQIVIEAKILAVADVVEAMSSHRPYRPAIGLDKALKEIVNNKGVLYDAKAVDACMRVFSGGAFKFDD
jgi:PAS domain S-box-containing protein/putative nucleotidyltransferase with HDIG domain